jgi:hypothetical protein
VRTRPLSPALVVVVLAVRATVARQTRAVEAVSVVGGLLAAPAVLTHLAPPARPRLVLTLGTAPP